MTRSKSSWRSRTLHRLQDALPRLTSLVNRKSRKGRKALLSIFEGQRRDLVDGLRSARGNDKVTNLQQLLALPLELNDLESCLHILSSCGTDSTQTQSHTGPLNISEMEANATFLANFVVGNEGNSTGVATADSTSASAQAAELLETLRTPGTSTPQPYRVGSMAQLTAVVLMVAQILIGAQLLRRYRYRKNPKNAQNQPTSTAPPTSYKTPQRGTSDPATESRRGRSRSPIVESTTPTRSRSRVDGGGHSPRRSRSRSRARFVEEDAPLRGRRRCRSRSRSFDLGADEPPPLSPKPKAQSTASDGNGNTNNRNNRNSATGEHDDNGTAETDSLSLSEGHPQNIKEDQNQHRQNNSKTNTAAAATTRTTNTNTNTNTSSAQDVLALLSFEGSTRNQLDNSRKLPTPSFAQDNFSLRLSKLKNELFHVKQEQKSKLEDSTLHIQLRYQETNKQYHALSKRLQNLTASINTNPPPSITPTSTPTRRPISPLRRLPSPEQVQVQANMQAQNEERTELLGKVSTLQQDLKSQQEQHFHDLQQREDTLQQMNTKIQFLSHELERRVLHSRAVEAEMNTKRKQEGQVTQSSQEVLALRHQQMQLSHQLQDTKQMFDAKERECQELLQKLRQVPPPSAAMSSAENEATAEEHHILMKELEQQLDQQDKMNRKTLEMTQLLESKRCDVIERTKQMELLSKNIEEQRIRVEAMEVEAARHSYSSQPTEELERELAELQERYESQSLECEKLNEIINTKSKLVQEKEADCYELTSRLEEMTRKVEEKEAQIEQLEQDVQDKQDLAAQNEAITSELQVQQELQEKMNHTTLQMISLLEEKELSNADLTMKLEALTEELNRSKGKA